MPKLIEYISDFNGTNKGVLEHLIVTPLRVFEKKLFSFEINHLLFFFLQGMIDVFSKYVEMVETTIDLNRIRNHEYVIKPDYDKDLKGIEK